MRPLEGIRVLSLSMSAPGTQVADILADAGARVTRMAPEDAAGEAGNTTDVLIQDASEGPSNGISPRYHIYHTADTGYVVVAAVDGQRWENLCERLQLDESLRDDGVDPMATLNALVEVFGLYDSQYWRDKFENRDVGCVVVNTLPAGLRCVAPFPVSKKVGSATP